MHICERILHEFPKEDLLPTIPARAESDFCSDIPDIRLSSSEDSKDQSEQDSKATNTTSLSGFAPENFPVPNEMSALIKDHGHQCVWDLIALNNLFCSLPKAGLSDNAFVDFFFYPSLSPVKMIAYLQNSSVPKDTIELRHGTGYTDTQALRQEIQKTRLFVE